jgi:hypothetical protein
MAVGARAPGDSRHRSWSDRLVDRLVAWGGLDRVGKRIGEHRAAGADHVCIQVLTDNPAVLPRAEWRELATLIPSIG